MWHNRGDRFEIVSSIWVEDIREYIFLFVHKEILSVEETLNDPCEAKCKYIWLYKWELMDSEYFTTLLDQHAEEIDKAEVNQLQQRFNRLMDHQEVTNSMTNGNNQLFPFA